MEGGAVGRLGCGQLNETLRNVNAGDANAPPGELVAVAPRATADIEQRHPRLEAEQHDERVHLPHGALGERIAQVGGTEVVGQPFKPVPVAWVVGGKTGLWVDRHHGPQ